MRPIKTVILPHMILPYVSATLTLGWKSFALYLNVNALPYAANMVPAMQKRQGPAGLGELRGLQKWGK